MVCCSKLIELVPPVSIQIMSTLAGDMLYKQQFAIATVVSTYAHVVDLCR